MLVIGAIMLEKGKFNLIYSSLFA